MVGGHYVAYCLVDPGKVFGDRTEEVNVEDGMKELAIGEHGAKGRKQDRRVWCFCSEWVLGFWSFAMLMGSQHFHSTGDG